MFLLKLVPDGLLRSAVFPGLWLDPGALLPLNGARVFDVLDMGLRSPEHQDFVRHLASQPGKLPQNG